MRRGIRRSNNRKQETTKDPPGVTENSKQENNGHEDEEAKMTETGHSETLRLQRIMVNYRRRRNRN